MGLHEFRDMITNEVYDILQPEVMVVGGPTEMRKIGALAAAFRRKIIPHRGGSALGIMSHLHLVASWSHAPYIELLHDPPISDYQHLFAELDQCPQVDSKGCFELSKSLGLGVNIDPAAKV